MSNTEVNQKQVNAFKEALNNELDRWVEFMGNLKKQINETEDGQVSLAYDFANKLITACDKEFHYWNVQQEIIKQKALDAQAKNDSIEDDGNEKSV